MILEPFEYYCPETIDEACSVLEENADRARIIAGGQSLIPAMKEGAMIPVLVDIKKIPGLSGIYLSGKDHRDLHIGSLVTHSHIASSNIVKESLPLISRTASGIGTMQVRNRGTIGGSLSHGHPAADLCTASLAMKGRVSISGKGGRKREVPLEKFFTGPLTTDLREGEILTEVIFPVPELRTGYDVQKLTIGHGDFPLFIAAVHLEFNGQIFKEVSIGLGGVSDTVVRGHEIEKTLTGKPIIGKDEIDAACRIAVETCEPPESNELSEKYTMRMVEVYLGRALRNSSEMITG